MPYSARPVTHQRQISSYNRLLRRVNHLLTTPRARRECQANLSPLPGDLPDDWERLLEEIEQDDNARMIKRPDGSVWVCWRSIQPG
jgi:hypothetical protein